MLTLLKNIERFNKRYNKKRGSAMLMVLMTMAIIIVVGTSMLFVTLSSFSNSIADTQQERAYNAALVMTETLKSSSYLGKLIESNSFELEQDNPVKLQFDNGDLDDELDDFTIINGVKVYVTFTNASKEKTSLDSVLVDVRGVKGSQERTVSFTYNKETTVKNVTLKDTFGNALVTNNDLGGEQKRDDLVFKRIEGDISINCWDEEVVNGQTVKKMTTRYFNPIILEGLTGSIFANGDLIIGAADNVIKVQGNIYCDGNLTIRGLDLGVNLPALYKKTYNKKYIKYSTIGNKTFAGFDILGTGTYIEREQEGKVNEAMYLKYKTKNGDDDFLPLQVYDEVSHYTLMDLADENAETYTFWTRNWENGGAIEEVTITLRVRVNGELQAVDATYNNKSGINNAQYIGATMYSTPECNPEDMIMQYPKGGNVYCSGDVIFDRVNYGYNWVYAPAALGNSTEYQYHDLAIYDGKGTIDASNKNDCEKVENATVSYNKTKMRGDIFCMGRMIIAPENLAFTSKSTGYKDEALVFTRMNGSNFNRYLDKDTINNQIYSNGNDFFTRLKEVFGFNGNKWNYNLNKTYNYDYTGGYRLYSNNGNIENREYYKTAENFKNENLKPFIEQLKGNNGQTYTDLKNLFKDIINKEKDNNSGKLYNSDYILKGDGYLPGMGTGDGEHYVLHPVEFSETSNIYIYNWNYASLIENTENKEGSEEKVKIQRQLNSTSLVQEARVDNTLDNTSVSTVNDTTYKAALTVKYQTLNVNEIYVGSGNIEAVGIDAFGYESDAEVRAKKIDTIGDMISNEYQEQSLLDIIMKIYGLNEEQALEKLKKDFVEDVKQLALLSNSDKNSFKAITSKEDVDNMIKADTTTKVGESAFLSVRAFSDEDHGMYLRSSNARYANADKNSSVSAVFREIIDEGFVKIAILKTTKLTAEFMRDQIDTGKITVNEYNQVSEVQDDASLNPLRELKQDHAILRELREGSTTYTIAQLNEWQQNGDIRGTTNFYNIDSLAYIKGKGNDSISNVWTYVRHRLTFLGSKEKFYAIYNSGSVDKNVRVLRFTNGGKNVTPLTCDNTFGLDPLYCTYDDEGNPVGGNQGGVFTNLSLTGIRTQVDYTISEDTYFNFGGEGTGGINTGLQDPVIFGASKDSGIIDSIKQLNNTKRMNITIDATEKDVYVYINAPSKYTKVESGKGSYVKNGDEYTLVGEGKGDYELQAGIEFRKCSWRVKGTHNAYIMLVGDTSINANAYKLSVNTGGGVFDNSADRSDSMLGTHFYSGFYTTYSGSYSLNEDDESSLKLAAKEVSTVESGNLCIIGTMGNQLLLGRGGYINGFVYLPNGKYVNNSTGFLGILPNAYSNNNQATIVAKDISVKGSNIGNLVFQAFDVSSSAGGAGSDIDIDYIESNEKITYTKWNFGGYYYG